MKGILACLFISAFSDAFDDGLRPLYRHTSCDINALDYP